MISPFKYQNIQDYLTALGFSVINGQFVRGSRSIDPQEFSAHTVVTFAEKARRLGWLDDEVAENPHDNLYQWGDQFIVMSSGRVSSYVPTMYPTQ